MSIFTEQISRNEFSQNNDRSKFLGGCYTYDWIIDGQNESTDDFEIVFTSLDEGDVMIMKAILIGNNGRQLRFTKVVDDHTRVIYRGKLPKDQRLNSKVRYWRPNHSHQLEISNRIEVTERWF